MDGDRKSTVSSFYGGRKSNDVLANEYGRPAGAAPSRAQGGDDASSFFSPDRMANTNPYDSAPQERSPGVTPGTAGYNRSSFFFAGRQEPLKGGRDEEEMRPRGNDSGPPDDSWDVYADFNNAGPRYSGAVFGNNNGYHALGGDASSPTLAKGEDGTESRNQVEYVTVPALGPEWGRSEMRDMTKAGKREKKAEARQQRWKEFSRGERGLFGKYITRRTLVFILFFTCVAIGVVLGICLPRVPAFSFNSDHPLSPASGDFNSSIPTYFNVAPANFSFPGFAELQLDTNNNYVPIKFNHLNARIYDLDTTREIGNGHLEGLSVPAKSFFNVQLPLNFTYAAANDSDVTWANWHSGCRNPGLNANGTRPAVKFRMELDMNILGLIGTKKTATQVSSADCPITLDMTQ